MKPVTRLETERVHADMTRPKATIRRTPVAQMERRNTRPDRAVIRSRSLLAAEVRIKTL